MAATFFTHFCPQSDIDNAFDIARNDALYSHACDEMEAECMCLACTAVDLSATYTTYTYDHTGTTGTVAEKTSYVLIEEAGIMSPDDALVLAGELRDANDARIDGVDDAAGVIQVESYTYSGWLFFGWGRSVEV